MDESVLDGVVLPRRRAELIRAGVTPGQLRGPGWRRTSQGLYLPAQVNAASCLQRVAAAVVRLPPAGAVGGWAAARVLGVEQCDGLAVDGVTPLDVPLVVGRRRIRSVAGIEPWMDDLPESDVVEVGRLRLTSGPRTTFDGMRRAADLVEAVVFVDQMTHAEIVTADEVRGYVDARPGWRGAAQARRAVDLGDPMAHNAWETRGRMVWMLGAGLPRPLCNPPVFDGDESLLGHPDLLDVEAGVVIEYDGSGHRRARQHDRDNLREERFERHGLVVMRVTRRDLDHIADLVARMRSTRGRGLARDRSRDRWTLEIPPSWGAMDAF